MSEELVPANTPEIVAWKTAQKIAGTPFVPDALRNRPAEVFAAILYGRELGMGPMAALRAVNVIKGKPTLAPEAMRARVFAAGHSIIAETYTDTEVTLVGKRGDNGDVAEVTWTLDDAKRAGLVKAGGAWTSYPRAMLLARATSELCRLLFPDAIAGASYTPEELGGENPPPDDSDVVEAEVVEVAGRAGTEQPQAASSGVTQQAAPTTDGMDGGHLSGPAHLDARVRACVCGHPEQTHDEGGCRGVVVAGEPNVAGADRPCSCVQFRPAYLARTR